MSKSITQRKKMKATKKQIEEVRVELERQGKSVENIQSLFDNCSLSIYKAIGAKGLVDAIENATKKTEAQKSGGIALSECNILKQTEKALFLSILVNNKRVEKWIAKSIIKNDIIPFWAVK